MKRMIAASFALLLTAAALAPAPVEAQQGYRFPQQGFPYAQERYRSPSGPTVTPYLDYFRRGTGVLDPYNEFVQPQRRQQQNFQNLQQRLDQQQSEVRQLRQEVQSIRPVDAGPTGVGSVFMNYSHYYGGR